MVIVILIALGLCFGSFTEALTWRIHEQAKPRKKRVASDRELSMSKGRSMCPHCQHTLAWYDLLPLLSWLSLKGQCRYCKKPIGLQAPLLEISMAALFILSYIVWPVALHGFLHGVRPWVDFGFWLAYLVGFVALLVYDLRWMLLPDRIVFPLLGLSITQVLIHTILFGEGLHALLPAVWGFLCLGGLFYVLFQISGGKWIGGGDVKLGFVLGILVGGPVMAFLVLFIASLLGSLSFIPLAVLSTSKRKEGEKALKKRIAFGPFLVVATIIVQLFGHVIVSWYQHHFLLV